MCLALYLFIDNELPVTTYNKENPAMYVELITDNKGSFIKWRSNKKYIYFIGSGTGCGCGWTELSEEDENNEKADKIKDRESLFQLLSQKNFTNDYIIICWAGDQGTTLKDVLPLQIPDIRNANFEIEELVCYMLQ